MARLEPASWRRASRFASARLAWAPTSPGTTAPLSSTGPTLDAYTKSPARRVGANVEPFALVAAISTSARRNPRTPGPTPGRHRRNLRSSLARRHHGGAEGRSSIHTMGQPRPHDVLLVLHAQLARDALRRNVLGADQRDHSAAAEGGERVVAERERGLGRDAAPPVRAGHEIADLGLRPPVDLLLDEADLTERRSRQPVFHQPEAVPVLRVAPLLPDEPGPGILARVDARVEPHDLGVAEHRRDEVEVVRPHLAEREAGGLEPEGPATWEGRT